MPKNNAGAMKMTETRIAHVKHFLVEDDAVIEDFIAVKCAASELMRPMSLDIKKLTEAELTPSSAKN